MNADLSFRHGDGGNTVHPYGAAEIAEVSAATDKEAARCADDAVGPRLNLKECEIALGIGGGAHVHRPAVVGGAHQGNLGAGNHQLPRIEYVVIVGVQV